MRWIVLALLPSLALAGSEFTDEEKAVLDPFDVQVCEASGEVKCVYNLKHEAKALIRFEKEKSSRDAPKLVVPKVGFGGYDTAEDWYAAKSYEAQANCSSLIERQFQWDYKWTNGWAAPRFLYANLAKKMPGVIVISGDEIKAQNGFGAWSRMIYRCYYDTNKKAVISIDLQKGRL